MDSRDGHGRSQITDRDDADGRIRSKACRSDVHLYVTVEPQAPSQLRGQAQAPFVAMKVRLAMAVGLFSHAPRSKCEMLTEQLHLYTLPDSSALF